MTVIEARKRAKGAGRKPAENPKSAYIKIMLYPAEKDAWFAEAARLGMDMSTWARNTLNNAINRAGEVEKIIGPEIVK